LAGVEGTKLKEMIDIFRPRIFKDAGHSPSSKIFVSVQGGDKSRGKGTIEGVNEKAA
jgi:hypothetical protein